MTRLATLIQTIGARLRVTRRLPLRPLFISLAATLLVWGACLSASMTLNPDAHAAGISPHCRVGGSELACLERYGGIAMEDAGAPAWQNAPSDYFFHRARLRGEPRPRWNPYFGSGYPIVLDGHTSRFAPTQWVLTHFPGDAGQDAVAFTRFALWTFAITWIVSLWGASFVLLCGVALSAALAPYGATYVNITFLDVDLLSPWFLLLVMAFQLGRLSLRTAAALSFALGVLVAAMSFQQAQVVLCVAMGVLALAAAPFTRARSLILVGCLGLGALCLVPSWLPVLRNIDQFISSRTLQCVAEEGVGGYKFWQRLWTHPSNPDRFVFLTAPGAVLLPWVPRRAWFVVIALVVIGAWTVWGLPHAACALPLVSGMRFVRHFLPHLEMLFIVAVGIAVVVLSRRLDRERPWWVLAATAAVAVLGVSYPPRPSFAADWALRAGTVATIVGLLAVCLYKPASTGWVHGRRLARSLFETGLALWAFTPFVLASSLPNAVLEHRVGARQLPPLPDVIDPTTPLGMVQKLSQQQDRRHYSPSGYLHPNWSQAIGVLDLLLLYALYPTGYYELNAALFKNWERDPQHGLIPDRFVHAPGSLAMSPEFQRVLAIHRVSLFTFDRGRAAFARAPSPYEAKKCQRLARSQLQGTESYVCPQVGGIGYFPSSVSVAASRAEALERLQPLTAAELLDSVVLGPEIDFSDAAGPTPREAEPGAGSVRSVRRWGDNLIYRLDVERAGMFVIADTYFRGWKARVNGQPAGISRANVAFKAVRVPAGRVVLKLRFSPVSL